MRVVSNSKELTAAIQYQYEQLADRFVKLLPSRGVLAEIGCGTGQLTVPLAQHLPGWSFRVVDSFRGSYTGGRRKLLNNLAKARVRRLVSVTVSDYAVWLKRQPSASCDAVLSSEFLPELDQKETRNFLKESARVVRQGGISINSFLSPVPNDNRQKLLITADSDPRWTEDPPKEWFSPTPKLVARILRESRFENIRMIQLKSGLIFKRNAARSLLNQWGVKRAFWREHETLLREEGIELPDWVIMVARRQ